MKFLIFYDDMFSQVDEKNLTYELISHISYSDAAVFRFNPETEQFEEYNPYNNIFNTVTLYEDEEESRCRDHDRIISGLRGGTFESTLHVDNDTDGQEQLVRLFHKLS